LTLEVVGMDDPTIVVEIDFFRCGGGRVLWPV
jgi:hypothetical protein